MDKHIIQPIEVLKEARAFNIIEEMVAEGRLYDYQADAARRIGMHGGILQAGVGTGKSRIAIAWWLLRSLPKTELIIVTTAKKRDSNEWVQEIFSDSKMGLKNRIAMERRTVTVISWNKLPELAKELVNDIHRLSNCTFIFDEQKLVSRSGAWVKAFLSVVNHKDIPVGTVKWVLLTATPCEKWEDLYAVYRALGYVYSWYEFESRYMIMRYSKTYPERMGYRNIPQLVKIRDEITTYVTVPGAPKPKKERKNKPGPKVPAPKNRVMHEVLVDADWDMYTQALKTGRRLISDGGGKEGTPMKDASERFRQLRRICVDGPFTRSAKTDHIRNLIESSDHNKIILFYSYNTELAAIRTMAQRIKYLHGEKFGYAEWNGHKHDPITDLTDGEYDWWVYAVQINSGAEGWNCVDTDTVVFWSPPYSFKMFEQALGRIDRVNSKFDDLHYYLYRTVLPVDNKIVKALVERRMFNNNHVSTKFDPSYIHKSINVDPECADVSDIRGKGEKYQWLGEEGRTTDVRFSYHERLTPELVR